MLRVRVIPCLLLFKNGLYKTVRFRNPGYVGDPINAIKIFNEKEVDELIVLDITASSENRSPNFKLISSIASECFMPLSYGGGVRSFDDVAKVLEIGVEKISLNTSLYENPGLVQETAKAFGTQCIIASIDVKKNFLGRWQVFVSRGTKNTGKDPVEYARRAEDLGAGEILLTSIDREGTWDGYDVDLVQRVSAAVSVPVIANGGAGNVGHLGEVVKRGHASALALGSMVVYQKKGLGVLINFPRRTDLERTLN